MALNSDQEARFIEIRDVVDDDKSRLSKWELGFLYEDDEDADYGVGLFVAYDQHGPATSVTPKQWGILERIAGKYGIDN